MSKRTNGDGSYRQRPDGLWEVRITLPNGKRKSLYGRTQAEVKAKQTAALSEIQQGIDISKKPETMELFLNRWLADRVTITCAPKTTESYASMLKLHIVPVIGRTKLKDLRTPEIDRMLRAMTDAGLSARTVTYCRAVLRAALNYALDARLITFNPAAHATVPKRVKKEQEWLKPAQSRALLEQAQKPAKDGGDPDLTPMITVALYTGLRIGELCGLRWQDIGLPDKQLRVRQTVSWVHKSGEHARSWQFGQPKTEKSARTLALSASTIAALTVQRDRQTFWRRDAKDRWNDLDLVFSSTTGTPLDHSNLTRRLHKLLRAADLPQMGWHGLRHSAASLLAAQRVPMRLIMEQLGHSQMSLTSDLYAHIAPSMLEGNADALEKAMKSG